MTGAKLVIVLTAVTLASLGCAHTQPPERRIYVIVERAFASDSGAELGTGGAGADAYCNEVQIRCHKRCMKKVPKAMSFKKGSPEHNQYCTTECLREFMKCVKEQEELERQEQKRELHFRNIDNALSWLKEHKTEIAVGTIVIVAGVAFVVAAGGAGALILAPLAF